MWFAGLSVEERLGKCVISNIFSSGPAARAGLREGDVLVEIDCIPCTPENIHKILAQIIDSPSSDVEILISRTQDEEPLKILLRREPLRRREQIKYFNEQSDLRESFLHRRGENNNNNHNNFDDFDGNGRNSRDFFQSPSWRVSCREISPSTWVFLVAVDAGFQFRDEIFSIRQEIERISDNPHTFSLHLPAHFHRNSYSENTLHVIVARAHLCPYRLALSLFFAPLSPFLRSAYNWEEASVKITREKSLVDLNLDRMVRELKAVDGGEGGGRGQNNKSATLVVGEKILQTSSLLFSKALLTAGIRKKPEDPINNSNYSPIKNDNNNNDNDNDKSLSDGRKAGPSVVVSLVANYGKQILSLLSEITNNNNNDNNNNRKNDRKSSVQSEEATKIPANIDESTITSESSLLSSSSSPPLSSSSVDGMTMHEAVVAMGSTELRA